MTIASLARLKFTALLACGLAAAAACPAHADRIENQVAIFSALDKVTARISKFEVALGQTVKFGALKVTPRVCFSRPTTEQPKTTTFVEVDEMQLDGKEKRIFTGWMFAESPGLYGVEHPVFDVWLTECQKPLKTTAQKAPDAAAAKPSAKNADGTLPSTGPSSGPSTGAGGDAAAADAYDPAAGTPVEPRRRVRR